EIFPRIDSRDTAPPAPIIGLDKRGQTHVIDDSLPVERIFEVPKRLSHNSFLVVLLRKKNCLWNRDSHVSRQRIVEEFVVRGPPEWIVKHLHTRQHRALQICSIERDFVRDSVHNNVVLALLSHGNPAQRYILGGHTRISAVDLIQQRLRKGSFPADQQPYFHVLLPDFLPQGLDSLWQSPQVTNTLTVAKTAVRASPSALS